MPILKNAKVAFAIALCASMASTTNAGGLRERHIATPLSVTAIDQVPAAVSVLDAEDLAQNGITSLSDLTSGLHSPLKVQPSPLNSSTLYLTIRGIGAINADQPARDPNVGVYVDGVYLARSQGLGFDILDAERIEVLRGPQGVLFGRNTAGGAVNIISKKPSGELDFSQQFTFGSEYDEFKSISHIDLPETAGLRGKLSYVVNQHDGWVDNIDQNDLPDRENFWKKDNEGFRVAVSWVGNDDISVDYAYEDNATHATHPYFQSSIDSRDKVASESFFLPESEIDVEAHTLTATWTINDEMTLKSITASRELEELGFFNFGEESTLARGDHQKSDQLSQEFQLLGTLFDDSVDYIVGVSYFDEDIDIDLSRLGTNDPNGLPFPSASVVPFGNANPVTGFAVSEFSRSIVDAEVESIAVYAQVTYQLTDMIDLIAGVRNTEDDRDIKAAVSSHDVDNKFARVEDDHTDYSVTLDFTLTDNMSAYVTYGTAHRAGGGSALSESAELFDKEVTESAEIGFKGNFWDGRISLAAAVFDVTVDDQQIDFESPDNASIVEVLNATEDSDYEGFELDAGFSPADGLVFSLHYSYLDSEVAPINSPFVDRDPADVAAFALLGVVDTHVYEGPGAGELVTFNNAQAPRHSGAFSIDYEAPALDFGVMSFHLDLISSSSYFYTSNIDESSSRDIVNGRITLSDIELEDDSGSLQISLWGNNLNDEAYIVNAISTPTGLRRAFGEPRTYGVDVVYQF